MNKKYNLLVSFGLSFSFSVINAPVHAELPSLATDRHAPSGSASNHQSLLDDLDALRRGSVQTNFGEINYRLARDGLETRFRVAGTSTRAVLNYRGEHRLEADWRTRGGKLTLAITGDEGNSYRIEFTRHF